MSKRSLTEFIVEYGLVIFGFIALCILSLSTTLLVSTPTVDKDTILLTAENTLVLNTEVNGESEGAILNRAKLLDRHLAPGEPMYLYLNTPGGSVQAGEEMIEALTAIGRPVHTISAFSASMGFQIAENLGTRYILSTGVMMGHRAAGGVQGSFGGEEPSQMANRYSLMVREMADLDMRVVKRTNGKQTLASYQKAYANELYIRGQEAVEQGYADKVTKVKCDSSLSGTTKHSTNMMGFKVDYELDKCPLNSNPQNISVAMSTTKGFMSEDKFVQSSGGFGLGCIQSAAIDKNKLCALDINMNWDTIPSVRKTFISNFEKRRSSIIPAGL
jgi:ATP-dependent Clp protease protease subunit